MCRAPTEQNTHSNRKNNPSAVAHRMNTQRAAIQIAGGAAHHFMSRQQSDVANILPPVPTCMHARTTAANTKRIDLLRVMTQCMMPKNYQNSLRVSPCIPHPRRPQSHPVCHDSRGRFTSASPSAHPPASPPSEHSAGAFFGFFRKNAENFPVSLPRALP